MSTPTELPGMIGKGVERISIAEIDELIDRYVKLRDVRMQHTEKEVEAKTKLIEALHGYADKIGTDKDGTIVYRHDDLICTLKHGKEDLKVKTETDNGE
jgi:hypothetical protein